MVFVKIEESRHLRNLSRPQVQWWIWECLEKGIPRSMEKLWEQIKALRERKTRLEPEEEEIRKKMKPHVREVQNKRAHALIVDLIHKDYKDQNGQVIDDFSKVVVEGPEVIGPVEDLKGITEELEFARNQTPRVGTTERQKEEGKRKPNFVKTEDAKELEETTWNRLGWKCEVAWENITSIVTYMFPSRQESTGKLRSIADFQDANSFSPYRGKMILRAHAAILQIIQSIFAGRKAQTRFRFQGKKDVSKDIDEVKKGEGKGEEEEETFKEKEKDQGRLVMISLDLKGCYYQNAVGEPEKNILAIWSEEKGKYRYARSTCTEFGNIHSIFTQVRYAEFLSYMRQSQR